MKYKMIQRANPQDGTKAKRYASPVNEGKIVLTMTTAILLVMLAACGGGKSEKTDGEAGKLAGTTWSGEATFSESNIVVLFDLRFTDGKSCELKSAMKVATETSLSKGTYTVDGSTVALDFGDELDGMTFTLNGNRLVSESESTKIVLKKNQQ